MTVRIQNGIANIFVQFLYRKAPSQSEILVSLARLSLLCLYLSMGLWPTTYHIPGIRCAQHTTPVGQLADTTLAQNKILAKLSAYFMLYRSAQQIKRLRTVQVLGYLACRTGPDTVLFKYLTRTYTKGNFDSWYVAVKTPRTSANSICYVLLRGTIVNRTCGTHKNLPGIIYLTIFTNNFGTNNYGPP